MLEGPQLGQSTGHSSLSVAEGAVQGVGLVVEAAAVSLDWLSETLLSAYQVHQIAASVSDYKLNHNLSLCRPDTLKGALWQTVQTQIRCHIMWHLIRVYNV